MNFDEIKGSKTIKKLFGGIFGKDERKISRERFLIIKKCFECIMRKRIEQLLNNFQYLIGTPS